MPIRVREMIRLIEDDGWFHIRTTGSHRQFHHPIKPGTVTIAGELHKELPKSIERSIFKQPGIRR